jgi:hypothetical protein
MEIRISVLASDEILLNGNAAQFSTVKSALESADTKDDVVLYYRENAGAEPSPDALKVVDIIIAQKLAICLCSTPDFSEYVDDFGQSHPRPIYDARLRDPFEPRMPDVDLGLNIEDVFAKVRKLASHDTNGGVVMVGPDRRLWVLPPLPESPETDGIPLPDIIPMDRNCNVAVISNTFFMTNARVEPDLDDACKAIPFLGYLIRWSRDHQVWVFEGHPSALAAGLTDSEFLLLDSAMLPFLQPDWMAVAKRAMTTEGKVFLFGREEYSLNLLAASDRPPGWRISEDDGEASYANCLLTTLAKGSARSVTIISGSPLPDLATLTRDPEELDWIAELPFRYDALDAQEVINVLLGAAGEGKSGLFQKEWVFTAKLLSRGVSSMHSFLFRRERNWRKTILHISKR